MACLVSASAPTLLHELRSVVLGAALLLLLVLLVVGEYPQLLEHHAAGGLGVQLPHVSCHVLKEAHSLVCPLLVYYSSSGPRGRTCLMVMSPDVVTSASVCLGSSLA